MTTLVLPDGTKKFVFDCGCFTSYKKGDAMIHEKFCPTHTEVFKQTATGKDGFVATGKVNLDTFKNKVIVSTAKQQLARHYSYTYFVTHTKKRGVRK